jgi:hypothetical protein
MAERHVYYIQFQTGTGEGGRAFSVVFECLHASVEAMAALLKSDGIVEGFKLDTVDDGRGGRMIRSRAGFAFGIHGLVAMQVYFKPVWEPED